MPEVNKKCEPVENSNRQSCSTDSYPNGNDKIEEYNGGDVPSQNLKSKIELPMRWFKFVIWVQLFLSALMNVGYGSGFITGEVYDGYAETVYENYQMLRVIDCIFGVACIVLAIGAIYIRFQLSKFKRNAPNLYIIYLCIATFVPICYTIVISLYVGMWMDNSASIIGNLIVYIPMIALNRIYFNKRKYMFVTL